MATRKRVKKAKLLAYPKDWFICFFIGYVTGVLTWPILTSLFT